MGFFTEDELENLTIRRMILHVVGGDEFEPEEEQDVEHSEFFIDRIRDTDVASVHQFSDLSATKRMAGDIAQGNITFQDAAQTLSREFARFHSGNAVDGAFFIFELDAGRVETKFYSLIKYDYREAIERRNVDDRSLLRRIVNAFIADKKAIQKSALIRVTDGVVSPDVAARDRARQSPDIGDYFARFLDVQRIRDNQQLTRDLVVALRKILESCEDILPEGGVSRALATARTHLRERQVINEEAITDAITSAAGHPTSERTINRIQRDVERKLKTAKLDGVAFNPDRSVLRKAPMRQLKTTEGITLKYPDGNHGNLVTRLEQPNGGELITIRTNMVTEDRIVGDKSR